jgi:hypothetical protein
MDAIGPSEPCRYRPGIVAAGGVLMALGVAMLLDTTGAIDVRIGPLIGPLALIAIGTSMMFGKGGVVYGRRERAEDGSIRTRVRTRGGSKNGFWMIGIGVWMMVSQMHLFGLNYGNSWPLFIILSGIMMVARGAR